MPKLIINAEPGTTFTNNGSRVLYQFIVNWQNSCGLCCQMDHAIGSFWPIPLHRGCRCQQRPVPPGGESLPFVDFRDEVAKLGRVQQSRVVGRANLTLIDKGVVKWSDVVTSTRVRDFREVVSLKKLSVKQMTKAGVSGYEATKAYATVHTPAHVLADQQRKKLIAALESKGVARTAVKQGVGEKVAERVRIGDGPSGSQGMPGKPKPPPTVSPVVAKHLGIKAPTSGPILPGRPIAERIAADKDGAKKVAALGRLDNRAKRLKAELQREADRHDAATKDYFSIDFPTDEQVAKYQATAKASSEKFWKLTEQIEKERRSLRDRARKILKASSPVRVEFDYGGGDDGNRHYDPADQTIRFRASLAREWLDGIIERGTGPDAFAVKVAKIPPDRTQRPHCVWSGEIMGHTPNDSTEIYAHEFGHAIEARMASSGGTVVKQSLEFLRHRVGDEPLRKFVELFPGHKYEDWERGRKDKFEDAFGEKGSAAWYVGKDYGELGTEILSMGLEKLYDDPVGFATKDPEYCRYVIGILSGALR